MKVFAIECTRVDTVLNCSVSSEMCWEDSVLWTVLSSCSVPSTGKDNKYKEDSEKKESVPVIHRFRDTVFKKNTHNTSEIRMCPLIIVVWI